MCPWSQKRSPDHALVGLPGAASRPSKAHNTSITDILSSALETIVITLQTIEQIFVDFAANLRLPVTVRLWPRPKWCKASKRGKGCCYKNDVVSSVMFLSNGPFVSGLDCASG